eukprot:TRINITY_DN4183_c0_g1_i1.p1 TRINITY_DN4183_c0_g1~~TRINITY_DN4183_c0_g1_i1.p1  ORF type:complete len:490 (+),score=126.49 TRINITY_DN4183_c0_g1_i1:135-1604(+)
MEQLYHENYELKEHLQALLYEQESIRLRLTEYIYQNQSEQEYLAGRIKSVRSQYEEYESQIKVIRKRTDSIGGSNSDSIQYETDGQIKAATKQKLIDSLFFVDTSTDSSKFFPTVFLLTYRYFATTKEVISDIHKTYSQTPISPNDSSFHLRATNFVKEWIKDFSYDFTSDDEAYRECSLLIDSLIATDNKWGEKWTMGKRLKESLESKKRETASKQDNKNIFSQPAPTPYLPKTCTGASPGRYSVLDFNPIEVARQLTLKDYDLCKAIQPKECLGLAWTKKDKATRSPNLLKMIDRFNHVSRWVTYTIVMEPNLKKRTKILSFFVQLIQHLYELNNFNAIFAIVGGFGNSAVHRLAKTFGGLKPDRKKLLDEMRFLTDPVKSWGNYRIKIGKVDPPCVPFIGVYQTDLTFIEEGNPDKFAGTDLINFKKCRMIADVILLIQRYQQKPYNLDLVDVVQQFLSDENVEARKIEDRVLYEHSLRAEPRQNQ